MTFSPCTAPMRARVAAESVARASASGVPGVSFCSAVRSARPEMDSRGLAATSPSGVFCTSESENSSAVTGVITPSNWPDDMSSSWRLSNWAMVSGV